MTVIKWRDSYETGVEAVDNEHRKLVNLIAAMYVSLRDKEPQETVEKVLNEIVEYTQTHFVNEEALMEEALYPTIADHKKEHQDLIEEVSEYQQRLMSDFPDGRQDLYKFLRDWLINHIMDSDKAFGEFVAKK